LYLFLFFLHDFLLSFLAQWSFPDSLSISILILKCPDNYPFVQHFLKFFFICCLNCLGCWTTSNIECELIFLIHFDLIMKSTFFKRSFFNKDIGNFFSIVYFIIWVTFSPITIKVFKRIYWNNLVLLNFFFFNLVILVIRLR